MRDVTHWTQVPAISFAEFFIFIFFFAKKKRRRRRKSAFDSEGRAPPLETLFFRHFLAIFSPFFRHLVLSFFYDTEVSLSLYGGSDEVIGCVCFFLQFLGQGRGKFAKKKEGVGWVQQEQKKKDNNNKNKKKKEGGNLQHRVFPLVHHPLVASFSSPVGFLSADDDAAAADKTTIAPVS